MAFTDTSVAGHVYLQDGGASSIDDQEADWLNAAYLNSLAAAKGKNYAPYGFDVTADFTNNNFDLSAGVAYIEDTKDMPFRVWDDSEINRSDTLTLPFLTGTMTPDLTDVALQSTMGKNHVYVYYDWADGQDGTYIRVADTTADEPSGTDITSLRLAVIDAGASSVLPKNRVAGYEWDFMKSYEFSGASTATIDVPTHSYDKIWVEFKRVTGTSSGGSNYTMKMQINGNTGGYYQRTTQGSNSGISSAWVTEAPPSTISMTGGIAMMGSWPDSGIWTWHNRTPMAYKYFAFGGGNDTMTVGGQVDKIDLWWEAGDLVGGFNLWGRNHV